jgi:hypothetical protein
MARIKEISLQQMAPLRETSQKLSNFLKQNLSAYLAPMARILAPHAVLGEYMEGNSERARGAAESFALIKEHFDKIFRESFQLPGHLAGKVPPMKAKLKLYPWEYLYAIDDDPGQAIIISSPNSWVIAYDYPYTLNDLLRAKLAGDKPQASESKQLVVNTLTMWLALERQAGLKKILADLRFSVSVEHSPVAKDLPFMVATAAVGSFRPQDDVMKTVTQLSGRPVFEELIDEEAVQSIRDPLAEQLQALLG